MSRNKCKAGRACICKGMSLKERFEYFEPKLWEFQNADINTRKEILNKAHPCLIQLICEIALNILKENIVLPEDQYERLKPYKRMLLNLCQPGRTLKQRKKVLLRALGGFLPKVLPSVLSAVSAFAAHAFTKS